MQKKYIAIIPARGGSKGIPNKNIKLLNGEPLIKYTLDVAKQAVEEGIIQDVLLSTDSYDIAEIALKCGFAVPFMRPAEISGDDAKTIDALIHALGEMQKQGKFYDAVVTLQPTSPQRTFGDLYAAICQFDSGFSDSLISVYKDPKANGFNYYKMEDTIGIPLHKEHNQGIRKQDMPDIYVRNGAIYISSVDLLNKKNVIIGDRPELFVMPKERSVDIDNPEDFDFVEFLMRENE